MLHRSHCHSLCRIPNSSWSKIPVKNFPHQLNCANAVFWHLTSLLHEYHKTCHAQKHQFSHWDVIYEANWRSRFLGTFLSWLWKLETYLEVLWLDKGVRRWNLPLCNGARHDIYPQLPNGEDCPKHGDWSQCHIEGNPSIRLPCTTRDFLPLIIVTCVPASSCTYAIELLSNFWKLIVRMISKCISLKRTSS